MNRSRTLTSSIVLTSLIFGSTNPLQAQGTADALYYYCQNVIDQNVVRLETIPNVTVTKNSRFAPLTVPYPDAEAVLYRRYTFALSGSGVVNVWKSRKLMTEITKEIIDSCVGVAAVTFGRDRSSDSATVGRFPDGSLKQFTCAGDADPRTRKRIPPITWGRQACDL